MYIKDVGYITNNNIWRVNQEFLCVNGLIISHNATNDI